MSVELGKNQQNDSYISKNDLNVYRISTYLVDFPLVAGGIQGICQPIDPDRMFTAGEDRTGSFMVANLSKTVRPTSVWFLEQHIPAH